MSDWARNGTPQRRFIGPHFTEFLARDGSAARLVYTGRLDEEWLTKSIFLADATFDKSDSNIKKVKVVVKFAYSYNGDAHALLAEAGLAPKLWYCEFEEDVQMWVVVMDYV